MDIDDDELLFTGDDEGVIDVRGQQALGGRDDDDDELHQYVLTQTPDPDGRTFKNFQDDAQWRDIAADAHAMKAEKTAVRDAARVIADQARVKGIVDAMVNVGLVDDIREYYQYDERPPDVQAVIDRYIIDYLRLAPERRHSLVPPYGQSYIPGEAMQLKKGGYKSKSKSKKYRYKKKSKKSKTNKRRRSRSKSRSNKRQRHRSNKRSRKYRK